MKNQNPGYIYILRQNPPMFTSMGGKLCELFKLGMTNNIDKRTIQNNHSYRTGQNPSQWVQHITSSLLINKVKAEKLLKKLLANYKFSIPNNSAEEILAVPISKENELKEAFKKVIMKYKSPNRLLKDCMIIHEILLWNGTGHPYLGKTVYLYSTQKNGCPKLITGKVNFFNLKEEFLIVDEEGDSQKYSFREVKDMLVKPVLNWNKIRKVQLQRCIDMREIACEWNLRGPVSLKNWLKVFEGVDYLDDLEQDYNGYWGRFKKGTWLPYPRDETGNLLNYYLENCEAPLHKKKSSKSIAKK